MTPAGLPAIGYVRVSTGRQETSGLGMEAQQEAIRRSCAERGWELAETIEETGSTGRARPGLRAAMDRAQTLGGVLVVAKDDRASRSTIETLLLHERANREGWHFFCSNMPQVDTTTAEGRFMATVFAAFAELERERIRQRTRDAMAAKKARGEPVGRPRAMPAATMDRIIVLRREGLSLQAIADMLDAEGTRGPHGGTWRKRSVWLALKRYAPELAAGPTTTSRKARR